MLSLFAPASTSRGRAATLGLVPHDESSRWAQLFCTFLIRWRGPSWSIWSAEIGLIPRARLSAMQFRPLYGTFPTSEAGTRVKKNVRSKIISVGVRYMNEPPQKYGLLAQKKNDMQGPRKMQGPWNDCIANPMIVLKLLRNQTKHSRLENSL